MQHFYSRARANTYCPTFHQDIIEWNYACRPTIKGEPNRLKVSANGGKSPTETSIPGFNLLMGETMGKDNISLQPFWDMQLPQNYDYDQTYVNFELEALKTFSDNKFRKDVFAQYPLSEYIEGISKYGSMSKVTTKDSAPLLTWLQL